MGEPESIPPSFPPLRKPPRGHPAWGLGDEAGAPASRIKVLKKVEVVSGQVGDKPVLVAYCPSGSISIFEATLDGRRVTLGHSGYFEKERPILYDRGTQSLWAEG